MENIKSRKEKFDAFVADTGERVQKIGESLRKTIADMMDVQDRLFKKTEGDPKKVTDDMIKSEFEDQALQ
jgi:hypothetical protein